MIPFAFCDPTCPLWGRCLFLKHDPRTGKGESLNWMTEKGFKCIFSFFTVFLRNTHTYIYIYMFIYIYIYIYIYIIYINTMFTYVKTCCIDQFVLSRRGSHQTIIPSLRSKFLRESQRTKLILTASLKFNLYFTFLTIKKCYLSIN